MGIRLVCCAMGIVLFCFLSLNAGEVIVTSVVVSSGVALTGEGVAEIVFNQALKISDIQVRRIGGKTTLGFPQYVSRKGRVFPQVRLLTRQASEAARTAIETGTAADGLSKKLTYRIAGCTFFKKKSWFKGVASVRFNDAVEVQCKLAGKDGTWILWPEGKHGRGEQRRPQAAVLDKRLKESIEQDILQRKYEMASEGEPSGEERE